MTPKEGERWGEARRSKIVLEITDKWEFAEFLVLLEALDALYAVLSLLSLADEDKWISLEYLTPLWWFRRPWAAPSYRHLYPYVRPLRISRLEVGSPGIVSLVGSGEIIKELRELIKDIWWRNQAESKKAALEQEEKSLDNLKKRIEILERLGYPKQAISTVVLETEATIRALDSMVKEKKILSLPRGKEEK